jgi:hypothetical protein
MKKVLFVAFSHSLTEAQAAAWDQIITLKEVNPELQKTFSSVPATATLEEVQDLAAAIVKAAIMAESTHFFCAGEPSVTLWANLYASQLQAKNREIQADEQAEISSGALRGFSWRTKMICVQSTTERISEEKTNPDGTVTKVSRFDHVQWRELF